MIVRMCVFSSARVATNPIQGTFFRANVVRVTMTPSTLRAVDRISSLPALLLALIARHLVLEDVVCLAYTCRRLLEKMRPPPTSAAMLHFWPGDVRLTSFWSQLPTWVSSHDFPDLATTVRDDWRFFGVAAMVLFVRDRGERHNLVTMTRVAARCGYMDAVRRFLGRASANRDVYVAVCNAALLGAGRGGQVDIVDYALRIGACRTWDGKVERLHDGFQPCTAMQWACAEGHLGVIESLWNVASDEAMWPQEVHVWLAIRGGHADVLDVLLSRMPFFRPHLVQWLRWAVRTTHVDTILALLSYRCILREADMHALARDACVVDRPDALDTLLKTSTTGRQFDVACRALCAGQNEPVSMDLLRAACEHGHARVVRVLLRHLSWTLASTTAAQSVMISACGAGAPDVVAMLLDHPVFVAATASPSFACALRKAATHGHDKVLRLVLPLADGLVPAAKALALAEAESHGHVGAAKVLRHYATRRELCQ